MITEDTPKSWWIVHNWGGFTQWFLAYLLSIYSLSRFSFLHFSQVIWNPRLEEMTSSNHHSQLSKKHICFVKVRPPLLATIIFSCRVVIRQSTKSLFGGDPETKPTTLCLGPCFFKHVRMNHLILPASQLPKRFAKHGHTAEPQSFPLLFV